MVDLFFDEAESLVGFMRSAAADGNAPELARRAHRLRSTVVYLAAGPATAATELVERIGRSGTLNGAAEAIDQLARELRTLGEALSGLRPQ